MKHYISAILIVLIACTPAQLASEESTVITVYKSPNCGCCGGYISYLESSGYAVKTVQTANVDSIKQKYKVPEDMLSCHTSIAGKYFIEGHVPVEAIKKLLEEQPEIDGIALPGMPAGTPGMSGQKNEPWTIYSIKDGQISEYMTI